MTVALLAPTKRPPATMKPAETAVSTTLSITHSDKATLLGPRPKCEIGCLALLRHDIYDTEDIANARRRAIFYTRWHGLADPLLQLWRG